jgi:N-hydroxyarylamine O-acetyltransferase
LTTLFKPSYRSGIEDWLSESQANDFLRLLGVSAKPPSLAFLQTLVMAVYAQIPFQNLTMLTRERVPPTPAQIIDDMLSGIGGLCNTMNPFFVALLHQLGFSVGFLRGSMAQPDCHIGIVVELSGESYWLDLGNGFPYLQPLPILHGSRAQFLGFEYQLQFDEGRFYLRQNILGHIGTKINQHFTVEPCHYQVFDDIRHRHYQEAGFGPFLTGIRVTRWQPEAGFLLRDNQITSFPGNTFEAQPAQIMQWLRQHFNQGERLVHLIQQSWKVLYDH